MCGIVGFITSSQLANPDRIKFLEQGLVIDTLRGEDSTGIFTVPHEQNMDHRDGCAGYGKVVCDGYGFIHHDTYKNVLGKNWERYRAIVGHNRAATIGGVSIDTAHPFNVGPITLVHNGTLKDMSHMKHDDYDKESFNDSHAIARNLAELSPESVIEQLYGAFTLVWHDARDDKIRIVRNAERPLAMTVSRTGISSTLYFASEAGMLAWLLRRNKIPHGPIFEPKPGYLMTFDKNPEEPEMKKVELYEPDWSYSYTNNRAGYTAGGWQAAGKPATPRTELTHGTGVDTRVSVLGTKMDVPERLQEELLNHGLLVENTMSFAPRRAVPVAWRPDPTYMMCGELVDVSATWHKLTAVVYGCPQTLADNHMSHFWTVRPIGVKYGEDAQPIVVCKLVSFTKAKCGSVVDLAYWDALEEQREEAREADRALAMSEDDPTWLAGPYGSYVGPTDWLIATQGGCAWCAKSLSLLDADTVEWVNEGSMPVCGDCIEDMQSVVLN